jgi:hypothetical protein
MDVLKALYEEEDSYVDELVLMSVAPYFAHMTSFSNAANNKIDFGIYHDLEPNIKDTFRTILYSQPKKINCSKEEFLKLLEFLEFIQLDKDKYRSYVMHYVHTNAKNDIEFARQTVHIHLTPSYIYEYHDTSRMRMYLLLDGIQSDEKNVYELVEQNKDRSEHCRHAYGIMVRDYEKNAAKAIEIFKSNWDDHKYADSLAEYACMLYNGDGVTVNIREARKLFKLNWEENKHPSSLYHYMYMLSVGEGGPADEGEARRLAKINWEENYHLDSLRLYADWLSNGDAKDSNRIYNELVNQ